MADTWDPSVAETLVGARVRELRVAKGMTQTAMARAMTAQGFTWRQGTVSETELAGRPLRVNEAAALALVLGVKMTELFAEDDAELVHRAALAADAHHIAMWYEEMADLDARRTKLLAAIEEAKKRVAG